MTTLTPNPIVSIDDGLISEVQFAGHSCVQMANAHGVVIVSLHGGQVLSWVPTGQKEVFWLSQSALPEPAAIRGGVPVCWPWFGKQGMPDGAMQHGPVRNLGWHVVQTSESRSGLRMTLAPGAAQGVTPLPYAAGLRLRLTIELGATLSMTLQTENLSADPFVLTQALHNYFLVGDVEQVRLHGVEGLQYASRVDGTIDNMQHTPFALQTACDSTFFNSHTASPPGYRLVDPVWQREIGLTTEGSQSLVVWNPGERGAAAMADVPPTAWREFLCVEASNAGDDTITIPPGGQHCLRQTLSCKPFWLECNRPKD